jgi:molybdenum cofactor cytidylyltransferase
MNTTGLLLAAGRGQRFDPTGQRNKLLAALPAGGLVVAASARAMLAVLSRVIAVVPAEGEVADALRAAGCDVVLCPDAGSGMAASLVRGLQSAPDAGSWIIALGDMPYVAPSTILALRDALAAGAGIATPVHAGRRGNPVAFSAAYVPQLLALRGDQGARALLATETVTAIPVDDAGVLHDIDTPSDLNKTGTLPVGGQVQKS